MRPQWVLFFQTKAQTEHDIYNFNDAVIEKIVKQQHHSSNNSNNWLVYLDLDWSQKHLECTPEEIVEILSGHLKATELFRYCRLESIQSHRWRYAHAVEETEMDQIKSRHMPLYTGGDWTAGQGIQSAIKSALTLSEMFPSLE